MSKQILQLMMEDAIDDWHLAPEADSLAPERGHCCTRDSVAPRCKHFQTPFTGTLYADSDE
ncbi:hypothetical protein L195_g052282 [Trifolium pratense]|uniref:Uncharacterized protein n=1 Tax=Trifolium pratense TaxID=57577 RepID=A0A2K3K491_TRIPR|nr:hypothetical protein L195_g052282 [Trifolium pratense]